MTKSILLILLAGMSWIASAEMAYYKELPLDGVRHLRATGHINIELKAGNENRLELFLKPGVENDLKIGIETQVNKNSGIKTKTLHIREEFNKGEDKKAGHIADIVITTNKLTTAILDGVNSFKTDGYISPIGDFHLSAGRTKKVSLSNLNLNRLTVSSYFDAAVTVNNSQIDLLRLRQSRTSKVTLTDLQVLNGEFNVHSKSELKMAGVKMQRLLLEGRHSSKVVADSTSEIGFASFELSQKSQVDFSNAQVEQSTHQIEQSAQLNLKDGEVLLGEKPAVKAPW